MSSIRMRHNELRGRIIRTVTVSALLLLGWAIFYPTIAIALNTDDVREMTELYEKYDMPRNNMISYIGRLLGWMMINGISTLVGAIEDAVWQISELFNGFASSAGANSLVGKVATLGALLFVFVVLYLAWQAMMNKIKWSDLFQNAILSLVVLLLLPTVMTQALTLTQQAMAYIKGGESTSITDQLVSNNVIDVTGYDTAGEFALNGDIHPQGELFGGSGISITELVDPDDMTDQNADIYNQYVDNGELKEVNMAEFFGVKIDIFSTQYYRYKVNWFPIFMSLIISGIAFVFSGVKIARLLYELAINQALATFCAWLDVHSGQRLKKCLQMIVATFITLCGVYLCFAFYIIGQASVADWDIIPQLIAMLAMAWALIDGPNLFEKIVGVDAGLQDGVRTMYGIRAATNMTRSIGRGIFGTRMMDGSRVGGIVNHAKGAAGKVSQAAATGAEAGGRIVGNVAGRVQGQKPVHGQSPSSPNRYERRQPQTPDTTGTISRTSEPSVANQAIVTPSVAASTSAAPAKADMNSSVLGADTVHQTDASMPVMTSTEQSETGAAVSGAVIPPPDNTGTTDTRSVEEVAAASLETAREAAMQEQQTDTRRYDRTDETAAPVSMSDYIRRRNKTTGSVSLYQIRTNAIKGYQEGKEQRQTKLQRKADNARTPLGAEKIAVQGRASVARYERFQQRHTAIEERRKEIEASRKHKREVQEATNAYKWLEKHDPVDLPAPPPDETIYRADRSQRRE